MKYGVWQFNKYMGLGKIYIYTGEGKGKSNAALGLILKLISENNKVGLFYFDRLIDPRWLDYLHDISQGNLESFVVDINLRDSKTGAITDDIYLEDFEKGSEGLRNIEKVANLGLYDWLVLDEINAAIALGIVPLEDFLNFIKNKPAHLNLVLTGVNCPDCVKELGDLVTEFTHD